MIHLEVIVPDTAELLAIEAYGPGALLRWESGTDPAGPFVEGGTEPLVADVSLYDIWDAAGVVGVTWYRTRISDAGGTTFSDYSAPFETAAHGLYLSLTQAREFGLGVGMEDQALLILLDAALQDIVKAIGPLGEITEWQEAGRGDLLMVSRPILSVTSVRERWYYSAIDLASDDYEVIADATLLRVRTGTNPATYWRGRVGVTYLPTDDLAARQRVQKLLVEQDITAGPGLSGRRIGDWSEDYANNSVWNYQKERAAILATLTEGALIR